MTPIVYTDHTGIDHETSVDLSTYKRFSDLLRALYKEFGSTEDEGSFILGIRENDPDLFETYLQARYWQQLDPKVRNAVAFLAEPDHEFRSMTSFKQADALENDIVRTYGKPQYFPTEIDFFNAFKDKYSYNILYQVRVTPDYDEQDAFWDALAAAKPPKDAQPIYEALKKGEPEVYHFPDFVSAFKEWAKTLAPNPPITYGAPEPDIERFVRDTLYSMRDFVRAERGLNYPDDILLLRTSGVKTADASDTPAETESLVDTLKDVIDFNVAEDGKLDVKSDDTDTKPSAYDPKRDNDKAFGEEYEEGKEEDYTDLDADFDWKFYDEMRPGTRPWPIRDHSILYDPAAITRYNVDFYMNVASANVDVSPVVDAMRKMRVAVDGQEIKDPNGKFLVAVSSIYGTLPRNKAVAFNLKTSRVQSILDGIPRAIRNAAWAQAKAGKLKA